MLRNPGGGGRRSRDRATRIVGRLRGFGHTVVELTGDSPEGSSENLAAAVAAGEIDHIVLAGGDGLVHLAIQHLAETGIRVSIAPTGTGNDFATAVGIEPTDDLNLDAPHLDIDLLRATGAEQSTWVASIVIAGFPAAINRRANALDLPIGSHIYTLAAVLELPAFERQEMQLRLDGHPIATDSAMLAMGNTKLFGGGMLPCPDALPTDGLVHLTSIEGVGRRGLLPHLIGREGGTAERPEVLRRSGIQIDIDTAGIDLWGDGEPLGQSPMRLRVVPGALRVVGANPA